MFIQQYAGLVQKMAWRRLGTKPLNMNQWWLDYQSIYVSLSLNELTGLKEILALTYGGLVIPCGDIELGQHWLK